MRIHKVTGVSGSLRASSLNHLFLRAMALTCPENIHFSISTSPGELPLFNPDLEGNPPLTVQHWRKTLDQADLILLVSPEYAHGVSGVIKNALDWIVSSGELTNKPVAFPNLSIRTDLAQMQLKEILGVMGGLVSESCSPAATPEARYVIPEMSAQALASDPQTGPRLHALWQEILRVLPS